MIGGQAAPTLYNNFGGQAVYPPKSRRFFGTQVGNQRPATSIRQLINTYGIVKKLNKQLLLDSVNNGRIEWQRHSLERMMERNITRREVLDVLIGGEIIEEYPDDEPFPSALLLGWIENKPLHVVLSLDFENKSCFIITAYKPDLEHFEADFKTRRK